MVKNRIKELRIAKGLSLEELGKALKIGSSELSQYETGDSTPDIEVWQKIAAYFDVYVDYAKGYGYSKEYLLNLLREAYDTGYVATFDLFQGGLTEEISAVIAVNEFLGIGDKSFHSEIANQPMEWWVEKFNTFFIGPEMKRFLVTHKEYPDKELMWAITLFIDSRALINPELVNVYLRDRDKLTGPLAEAISRKIFKEQKAELSADELRGRALLIKFN